MTESAARTARIHQAISAGRAYALTVTDTQLYAGNDLDQWADRVTTWQGLLTAAMVQAVRTGTDRDMETVQARAAEVELAYLALSEAAR